MGRVNLRQLCSSWVLEGCGEVCDFCRRKSVQIPCNECNSLFAPHTVKLIAYIRKHSNTVHVFLFHFRYIYFGSWRDQKGYWQLLILLSSGHELSSNGLRINDWIWDIRHTQLSSFSKWYRLTAWELRHEGLGFWRVVEWETRFCETFLLAWSR